MINSDFHLRTIFHPTDFSLTSLTAFAHALKLALEAKAQLRIMHVDSDDPQWDEFPAVRETLAYWGLLPPGSPKSAVGQLGLQVEKIYQRGHDTTSSILSYLEREPADLIVLATHQRSGIARWMHQAIAEPIATQSHTMTLFVPPNTTGFIRSENGEIALRHVLLPVTAIPSPDRMVQAVVGLSTLLKATGVSCEILHVGTGKDMPTLTLPGNAGCCWTQSLRDGHIVGQILASAKQGSADLIAMATHGHKGFLDALRGSTTERVVREATCPVLALPAGL